MDISEPYHQIFYKTDIRLLDGSEDPEQTPPLVNHEEIPDEDCIEISDDLLAYFHDYFMWVETYNPVGPKEFHRGFNYCGHTVIRDENLVKFGEIVDSLISLFKNAPENIILRGSFCFGSPDGKMPPGSDPYRGYYKQIKREKDDVIRILGDLRMMTDRAIKNNGYLWHYGL